jgi:TrmH family RNA methyltransferase
VRIQIESASNPRLKTTRALDSRHGVLKQGAFLVEGPRFVSDQMSIRSPLWLVLSTEAGQAAAFVADMAGESGIDVLEVPSALFRELSDTVHSQGLLAVCPLPATTEQDLPSTGPLLLLDGLSDPGNMGTLIRSAAAFGCAAVIAGAGSCCPFIPKATRAAAGMNVRLPILFDADLPALMGRMRETRSFYGADVIGGSAEPMVAARERAGLVIGSEAHGISEPVKNILSGTVGIPMAPGVESLNAAVSGSILLYLLKKQRTN